MTQNATAFSLIDTCNVCGLFTAEPWDEEENPLRHFTKDRTGFLFYIFVRNRSFFFLPLLVFFL